ncbi:MAG: tetratricopeptide repeat protein [Planctomycetaceae bacterium]
MAYCVFYRDLFEGRGEIMLIVILAVWCLVTLALCVWMSTWPELQFHSVVPVGEQGDDPITASKEHTTRSVNKIIWGVVVLVIVLIAWTEWNNVRTALAATGLLLTIILFTYVKAWRMGRDDNRIAAIRDSDGVDAAIAEVRRMVEKQGESPALRHLLGRLLCDRADWQEALEEFDAAVADDPESNRFAHLARAVPLWHFNHRDEAEPLLIEHLKATPYDVRIYTLYAHLMSEAGRHEEARRVMPAIETLWRLRPLSEFDKEYLGGIIEDLRRQYPSSSSVQ